METLIIINEGAGCGGKTDEDKLVKRFHGDVVKFKDSKPEIPAKMYRRVVACGGDGTLNHLLNDFVGAKLYYIPCGTFNETSKGMKKYGAHEIFYAGEAEGRLFSYVLAAGAFTPLGYAVDVNQKKKLKILAYLLHVIDEYKIYRIPAEITVGGKTERDEYSLIMLSRSRRCFGFNFNRLYKPADGEIQLLTVKAPRHGGILGLIEMFFPFFRAFFIGFNHEHRGKTINFLSLREAAIKLYSPTAFCSDGDKWIMDGYIKAAAKKLQPPVTVIFPDEL